MKKFLLLLFILCLPFTLQGDGGWSGNSLRELNDTDADTEPEDDFVLQYDSLYELWFPTDIETFLDDIYLNLDGESTNVTNGTFDITTSGTGSFANLFFKHNLIGVEGEEEYNELSFRYGDIWFLAGITMDACYTLANSLKTVMNAHAADGAEHFQGGSPSPDTANFPITEDNADDWNSLVALTDALTIAYACHNSDAVEPTPTFHNAQATNQQLRTSSPVYSLWQIVDKLNNIKYRYNLHDEDATGHTTGGLHPEANADAVLDGFNSNIGGSMFVVGFDYFNFEMPINADIIDEETIGDGVTIEGVLVKDSNITTTGTAFLGLIDFGTNTIDDTAFTGDWAFNAGNLSGIGTLGAGATTLDSLVVDTTTLVANVAGYTDKVGIGTATPSAALEVASGRIQITSNTVPTAGAGLELGYSTLGTVLAYDRSGSAYKELNLNGSAIGFFNSGVQTAYLTDGKLGVGVDAVSNVLYPLHVSIRDANNDTVSNVMALDHRLTSGVGANGIGTGFILSAENDTGGRNGTMRFVGLLDDVTTGTVEGAARIDLNHHGAWTEAIKLSENYCIISKDVGIGTSSPDTKLQVVGDTKFGDDNTNYASFATDGELTLTGTARVTKSKTFTFNYATVRANGKPTQVSRGVFQGFSLPIYNNDNEELFTCQCIPYDWDGTSDPIVYIAGWIDTANNAKKFNLQVSVEWYNPTTNQVVPITTNDYPVETTTGNDAQYTSYIVAFTLDASAIAVPAHMPLGIRIRRLDASADEIAGEFVVEGMVIDYMANTLGEPTT